MSEPIAYILDDPKRGTGRTDLALRLAIQSTEVQEDVY